MALGNFIPKIWSARLQDNLEKALVYGNVVNTDYQGDISAFGDTVNINNIGAITIGDYAKNSTVVTPEELNGAQTQLLIDQAKYFAFKVDDIDKAQQNPKVMAKAMQQAAYGLRDSADMYMAGLHAQAGQTIGSTGTPESIDSRNVVEAFAALGQKLTEKNVGSEGRFVVIPPWLHTKLVLAKILNESNTETFTNGFVGNALGFKIFVSNNVKNTTGAKHKIMAGTTDAISFAAQVLNVEAYRPEAAFSDAVKGLYVFGSKVVQPDSLLTLTADAGSETKPVV